VPTSRAPTAAKPHIEEFLRQDVSDLTGYEDAWYRAGELARVFESAAVAG
jgi:hypothetical protein